MKTHRNFVLRTIRAGRIYLEGRWWIPDENRLDSRWAIKLDRQLDGQVWAFGIYWTGDQMLDSVYMWGPEYLYREQTEQSYTHMWHLKPAPNLIGTTFHWNFWHPVGAYHPGAMQALRKGRA